MNGPTLSPGTAAAQSDQHRPGYVWGDRGHLSAGGLLRWWC